MFGNLSIIRCMFAREQWNVHKCIHFYLYDRTDWEIPCFYEFTMNKLTGHIQDVVPLCMRVANDVVLVDENTQGSSLK